MQERTIPMYATDDKIARAAWLELCHRAFNEQDPIKLLDVTIQITKFLARKQERLDAEYDAAFDEAQETQNINQAQEAVRKNGVN
jgi:hypothetical protein